MELLTGYIGIGQTHILDKLTKSKKIVYEASDRVFWYWTNSQIGQTHKTEKIVYEASEASDRVY